MKKILIANRGEIACRIARTCRKLGIASVAVYSEADRHALHVQAADEAVYLGAAESSESYLAMDKVMSAAKKVGADAIHPGYGFLSENAEFAAEVEKNGLSFIGPSAEVIALLGDKVQAKKLAEEHSVPTLPNVTGKNGKQITPQEIKEFAQSVGYPILLKASAGGGGRGMRRVFQESEIEQALSSASREAKAFFGNESVFAEKLVVSARHIEIQAFGDAHGNVRTLFERDCSLQRNHQKVIEEAPAPQIADATKHLLHSSSKSLLQAAGYKNAATVEFLVDSEENVYFLEVNSRLQVEHPVTEAITGLDLVALQIDIAQGKDLNSLLPEGSLPPQASQHAIELRVCAEKPYEGFIASTGLLQKLTFPTPQEESLRIDTGFAQGNRVSHYYDSLLAKIIITGTSREEAISKAQQALQDAFIAGVDTNIGYLTELLHNEDFLSCQHHTKTADNCLELSIEQRAELICGAFLSLVAQTETPLPPFRLLPNTKHQSYFFSLGRTDYSLIVESMSENQSKVLVADLSESNTAPIAFSLSLHEHTPTHSLVSLNGIRHKLQAFWSDEHTGWIQLGGFATHVQRTWPTLKENKASSINSLNQLISPLPGKILSISATEGQEVSQGEKLITLESMKMEHPLEAPCAGSISSIEVKEGDVIESGALLISFG